MSYLFDAAADRLLITANVPLSNGDFTHMGYYRNIAATGSLQTIVARIRDDLNPYIWMGLLADGSFYCEDNNGGGGDFGIDVTYGSWFHMAYARSTSGNKLWINGTPVTTVGSAFGLGVADRYEVGGWRTSNGNRWNGLAGVLLAYTAFLSDADVAAQVGKAEPQRLTNLYGVWPLIEDGLDYSGNNNHWSVSGLDLAGAVPGVDYGSFTPGGSPIPVMMQNLRVQGVA